jgi:hypothetical protein
LAIFLAMASPIAPVAPVIKATLSPESYIGFIIEIKYNNINY